LAGQRGKGRPRQLIDETTAVRLRKTRHNLRAISQGTLRNTACGVFSRDFEFQVKDGMVFVVVGGEVLITGLCALSRGSSNSAGRRRSLSADGDPTEIKCRATAQQVIAADGPGGAGSSAHSPTQRRVLAPRGIRLGLEPTNHSRFTGARGPVPASEIARPPQHNCIFPWRGRARQGRSDLARF